MAGYVYLIGSTAFGWYKIGKSITPEIRVQNLGILFPFKIEVIAVWRAENHSMMETSLHEMYASNRINGEWFQFTKTEIKKFIQAVPIESCVEQKSLDKFSNIDKDIRGTRRVVGLRTKKMATHNLTPEECEQRRIASMEQQRLKKLQKSGTPSL